MDDQNRTGLASRSVLARYCVALVSVILGALARQALGQLLGPSALPFVFLFPAVAVAAWYGGFGPAIVALLLSMAAAVWMFLEPGLGWAYLTPADLASLAAFLLSSFVIIAAIDAMHRAQARALALTLRDAATQRKAHEAAARLAAIVEHSGDAMVTKNLDGFIQSWNASAERLFGYRADEIIGKHVTTLFPPDRLKEEDHILSNLRQGRAVERFETIRVAKDGRQIPVAISISPLRGPEGEIIGASKVIQDITALAAARDALVREKEFFATTLASIGDAVIVTDPQGRITFLNPEAERLTKWASAEAAGQPLPAVFRIISEQTRAPAENPVEKVLRMRGIVGLANHTLLIAKDGTETPIDDSAAPIYHADGSLLGVVLVFRDFTERKQAETALREANSKLADHAVHLEKVVHERTAKLQDMVDELQHVSYAIAHDMRAPLRAMSTFATLVAESAAGESAPETKDYCRRIVGGAARLDKLIQDALRYTKLAQQEMRMTPVDLAKLIRELVETYPNLQPDHADIKIENELPVVLGNDALLTQCFSNLLGNAVKFVPPGVRPQIRVSSKITDDLATICVKDNGIGIPKKAHDRLFKMFQKLEPGYEGTGIGLAIVRKVVERMGGKVGVESEEGKGSVFWVELPVSKPSQFRLTS